MKFKLETVKALLAYIEDSDEYPDPFLIDQVDGLEADSVTINYHLALMLEAGLIVGKERVNRDDRYVIVRRLTIAGHDFLANAQNPTVWKRFRETSRSVGSVSLDIAKSALSSIASSIITKAITGS